MEEVNESDEEVGDDGAGGDAGSIGDGGGVEEEDSSFVMPLMALRVSSRYPKNPPRSVLIERLETKGGGVGGNPPCFEIA